jgi:chloramphenicol 3-O-phosphotransferase
VTSGGFVIFLNGCYGVGKSAVLDRIGDLLAEGGRPFSLLDVDWFHRSWPTAPDDPENVLVEARNLSAVWRNYRASGPRQPVVSGVLATPDDRRRYERAFGLDVRPVRLEADDEVIAERLRRRYGADRPDALRWHLERVEELARRLRAVDQDERVISTSFRTPRAIAEDVLDHFGLLPGDGITSRRAPSGGSDATTGSAG